MGRIWSGIGRGDPQRFPVFDYYECETTLWYCSFILFRLTLRLESLPQILSKVLKMYLIMHHSLDECFSFLDGLPLHR